MSGLLRISRFRQLLDTPGSYAGAAGQAVLVKPSEDGVEFGPAGGGGGAHSAIVGDGAAVTFDVVHNLGTRALGGLAAWDVTTDPERRLAPVWLIVDDNTVRLTFQSAPAVDGARVVVLASGGSAGGTEPSAGANYLELTEPKVRTIDGFSTSADTNHTINISDDLPDDAEAVYMNFVCVPGSNSGFFDAWREGSWPGTSLINYFGNNIANMVLVGVTSSGTLRIRTKHAITVYGDLVGVVRPS